MGNACETPRVILQWVFAVGLGAAVWIGVVALGLATWLWFRRASGRR